MLGSFFDLKREVARIAAQRAAAESDLSAESQSRAYSDFDDRLQDFLLSFAGRRPPDPANVARVETAAPAVRAD